MTPPNLGFLQPAIWMGRRPHRYPTIYELQYPAFRRRSRWGNSLIFSLTKVFVLHSPNCPPSLIGASLYSPAMSGPKLSLKKSPRTNNKLIHFAIALISASNAFSHTTSHYAFTPLKRPSATAFSLAFPTFLLSASSVESLPILHLRRHHPQNSIYRYGNSAPITYAITSEQDTACLLISDKFRRIRSTFYKTA